MSKKQIIKNNITDSEINFENFIEHKKTEKQELLKLLHFIEKYPEEKKLKSTK